MFNGYLFGVKPDGTLSKRYVVDGVVGDWISDEDKKKEQDEWEKRVVEIYNRAFEEYDKKKEQ